MATMYCLFLSLVFFPSFASSAVVHHGSVHNRPNHTNHIVVDSSPENEIITDLKTENYHVKSQAILMLERWSDKAYVYLMTINCAQVHFTTPRECRKLQERNRSDMGIYLAEPSITGFYGIVLPERALGRSEGLHDAVLVLDPYTADDFGHLVLVFYIDLFIESSQCKQQQGIPTGKSPKRHVSSMCLKS